MVGDALDDGVVAGHKQKAAMRAVAHPSMVKAVTDASLKGDGFIVPITTFVSNKVEKKSSRVKKEKKFLDPRQRSMSYLHDLQLLNLWTITTYRPEKWKMALLSRKEELKEF